MEIQGKRFHIARPLAGGVAAPKSETVAPGLADKMAASPVTFADFAGEVRSRQSEAYVYVAPPVVTREAIVQSADLKLENLQAAMQDARIPVAKLAITQNGQTFTVNGLQLTVTQQGDKIRISASAVGLDQAQVDAATKKLVMIANAAKVLGMIDSNKHMMVQPEVLLEANGRLKIVTTANVKVNPKLDSQHQAVLDQMNGGLKMPEVKRNRLREQNKRAQTIG